MAPLPVLLTAQKTTLVILETGNLASLLVQITIVILWTLAPLLVQIMLKTRWTRWQLTKQGRRNLAPCRYCNRSLWLFERPGGLCGSLPSRVGGTWPPCRYCTVSKKIILFILKTRWGRWQLTKQGRRNLAPLPVLHSGCLRDQVDYVAAYQAG